MAYRAEIEIAVKGAQELNRFKQKLEQTSKVVDNLNVVLEVFGQGLPRNINNLNQALASAASNFNKVALGTSEAKLAAVDYLNATKNLNAGLRERAQLLVEVADNERKAKLASAGIRETTQYPGPIGPGAASAARLSSNLEQGRLSQRAKGLNQYQKPVFPQPDINREIARRSKLRSIARATAKIEQQRSKRLAGQNSLTSGLLRLNNAVLNAARSEAQARGESVAKQRALNNELAKSQQYSRPIGPKPQRAAPTRRGTGISGEGQAVLKLGGAYLALNKVVRQVGKSIDTATQAASGEQRIKALSAGFDDYREVLAATERAQEKFNLGTIESQDAFAQLFGRLRPAGFALSEVETIFNGFNTAAALTGATARESAGALLQLTQALGAGFLSGQEFNSVAEQAPAVLQAIAKEVDRPIGQLKQLARDGKLTSEVLLNALKRVETEGADRLAEALDTPAQKVKNLQNKVEDLNIELGKLVLPAVEEGLEGVSGAAEKATEEVIKTQQAAKTLNEQMGILDGFFKAIDANPVIKWLGDIGKAASNSALLLIPFASQIKTLVQLRDILAGQRPKFEDDGFIGPQVPENLKPLKDRLRLDDPDDPKEKGKADKAAERAAREEERLQERLAALRIELDLIGDNANFKAKITAAEIAGNKELAIRLKTRQAINTIQADLEKTLLRIDDIREISIEKEKAAALVQAANINAAAELAVLEDKKQKAFDAQIESLNFQYEILTATTVEEQKQLEIAQQMAALKGKDFTPDQLEEIKAAKEKLDIGPIETYVNELQRSLSDTESMVVSLAQSVESSLGTAMSSAVQSVITGTGSVQEAFSDMFANIGKAFIDMATQMIAKALVMKAIGILTSAFGGGGGGGGSMAGMFDLSGGQFGAFAEGGYVTGPTNALIGEGGEPEYVIPESKMRESMGRYSRGSRGGSVIPAEGGGSAGTEGGTAVAAPIDVRYTVERINSVDYVTADQFQNGMKRAAAEGAQRGQQLTLSRLQQSPSTRRRIGM